jgi:hypothetical protein
VSWRFSERLLARDYPIGFSWATTSLQAFSVIYRFDHRDRERLSLL